MILQQNSRCLFCSADVAQRTNKWSSAKVSAIPCMQPETCAIEVEVVTHALTASDGGSSLQVEFHLFVFPARVTL